MIKSVQKALSILTFVAQQDERPVSLGRIAQGVGLNVATCAHLVETLCEENYLEKVSRREGSTEMPTPPPSWLWMAETWALEVAMITAASASAFLI